MMKILLSFLLISLAAFLQAASLTELAEAAREVGREQGMPDADTPVPKTFPPFKVPRNAEGFFPAPAPGANPYREQMEFWIRKFQSGRKPEYGVSTPSKRILDRLGGSNPDYGTRTEAAIAKNLFYLVTAPDSPYHMDKELFRQYLRRILCYANEYNVHAKNYQDQLNDFFAFGPALYLMRMTDETYGNCLLPSQRAAIRKCMKKAAKFWGEVTQKERESTRYTKLGSYCNRDLGFANILLNIGLYLNDAKLLSDARELVHAQKKNQYPDGAFAYIGSQNESATYHSADIQLLTRYYVVTEDPVAKDLLKKSRICPLLANEPGGAADFWTAPAWKHTWNGGNYGTHESVAYFNFPDADLRFILNAGLLRKARQMPDALSIPFFRPTPAGLPLPSNYTVRDRNLDGFRARYGNWSQATTLRKVKRSDEPGLPTLTGAMTLQRFPDGETRPESILMFARPKVLFKTGKMKKFTWAYLTDSLRSDCVIGRDYSAFGASYRLHTDRSSTKGDSAPWEGRQVWLTVGDRMTGFLEIAPQGKQEAMQSAAELRFGYGGFRKKNEPKLERISDRLYRYGSLEVKILETNFPDFEVQLNKVRKDAMGADGTDLIFATASRLRTYRPGERYYVFVEIYPVGSSVKSEQTMVRRGGDSVSISLKTPEHSYRFTYQFSSARASMDTTDKAPARENFDALLRERK